MTISRFSFLLVISISTISLGFIANDVSSTKDKINGVNFVAPVKKVSSDCMESLQIINANWVALNPFIYGKSNDPNLQYNTSFQWWGETTEGTRETIRYAKQYNLKVLIKPHAWIQGEGWPGEYKLNNEASWLIWEKNYENYVLELAKVAEEEKAEMLALGTEWRKAVIERPLFWKQLIKKARLIYNGKLTYAANWDNYENISFWEELDYIGIDAYFPLSESITPSIDELTTKWQPIANKLSQYASIKRKPILFTEYGYRSINYTSWKQWQLPDGWLQNHDKNTNLIAQQNAYQALFETFWNKPWFAGGFIWKWHPKYQNAGGLNDNEYTPQNKPVEKLIKEVYSTN